MILRQPGWRLAPSERHVRRVTKSQTGGRYMNGRRQGRPFTASRIQGLALGCRIARTAAHLGLHYVVVLVVDEASIVARRRHLLVGRAAVEDHQILLVTVVPVGADHVTAGAARRDAIAVDLALEPRLDRDDRLAQRL